MKTALSIELWKTQANPALNWVMFENGTVSFDAYELGHDNFESGLDLRCRDVRAWPIHAGSISACKLCNPESEPTSIVAYSAYLGDFGLGAQSDNRLYCLVEREDMKKLLADGDAYFGIRSGDYSDIAIVAKALFRLDFKDQKILYRHKAAGFTNI